MKGLLRLELRLNHETHLLSRNLLEPCPLSGYFPEEARIFDEACIVW